MSYRDTSADTTLDNANEGIMSSEFDEWYLNALVKGPHVPTFLDAFNARQPEIDALKAENERLRNSTLDAEAVVWAAQKLQAFGVDNTSMDNAMMLDRLYAMLQGPVKMEGVKMNR